jgi:hypothetical protein
LVVSKGTGDLHLLYRPFYIKVNNYMEVNIRGHGKYTIQKELINDKSCPLRSLLSSNNFPLFHDLPNATIGFQALSLSPYFF